MDARARNQRSAAALYRFIERHAIFLETDLLFQSSMQGLTAVTFSLWRAVFLSDLTGELGHQLADVRRFLRSLIAHNTVLYQTDFISREWAFRYYLQNADFRLRQIAAGTNPVPPPPEVLGQVAGSAKDDWMAAQQALDTAISEFAKAIDVHDQP